MKKPIILFDIDYTLLDTDLLKEKMDSYICSFAKIKRKSLVMLNDEFIDRLQSTIAFSPRRYAQFLQKKLGAKSLKDYLLDLFFKNRQLYHSCLYPETINVLALLQENYKLGIFSEGTFHFQLAKVQLSGVKKYLDEKLIFIYPNKSGKAKELARQLGLITIVDDNIGNINELLLTKGVSPIWIKRGPKAEKEELKVKTILTLDELIEKKEILAE